MFCLQQFVSMNTFHDEFVCARRLRERFFCLRALKYTRRRCFKEFNFTPVKLVRFANYYYYRTRTTLKKALESRDAMIFIVKIEESILPDIQFLLLLLSLLYTRQSK